MSNVKDIKVYSLDEILLENRNINREYDKLYELYKLAKAELKKEVIFKIKVMSRLEDIDNKLKLLFEDFQSSEL